MKNAEILKEVSSLLEPASKGVDLPALTIQAASLERFRLPQLLQERIPRSGRSPEAGARVIRALQFISLHATRGQHPGGSLSSGAEIHPRFFFIFFSSILSILSKKKKDTLLSHIHSKRHSF